MTITGWIPNTFGNKNPYSSILFLIQISYLYVPLSKPLHMEDIFYDIFMGLPRQGPGNEYSTNQAIHLIKDLPVQTNILDIGCGTGTQTFQLAYNLGGTIYALDNHKPYLELLRQKANQLGYSDSVIPVYGEMNQLEFMPGYFDVIWAEGSIYIMGFDNGLNYLKPFLKDTGYLAVTEITWLRNNQPKELLAFWEQEYAAMTSLEGNLKTIEQAGYDLVDYFNLAPVAWWDDFYTPLEERLATMREKYIENESALETIEFVQLEIDLYRKYPDFYGYVFYIMKKGS